MVVKQSVGVPVAMALEKKEPPGSVAGLLAAWAMGAHTQGVAACKNNIQEAVTGVN